MWRVAYAAERSTLLGSLPENAPPPCAPFATVSIYDDLATGQTSIAMRAAYHKLPRWVYVILNVVC